MECDNLKLTIPNWHESDRPREKFLAQGAAGLTNAELIAILLRSGTADESALDLAKSLLSANDNSLNGLANLSIQELKKFHGIGTVKAITLQVAFELGRRRRAENVKNQRIIKHIGDVFELMQSKLSDLKHEEFWGVFLNRASALIGMENFGKGSLSETTVNIRAIVQKALECSATAIVLCHNHPSGNVTPSDKDVALTLQIRDAAALFQITVLDHLIMGTENYYSFANSGVI